MEINTNIHTLDMDGYQNPCDPAFTGPSPCENCPRHLAGVNKNSCVDGCKKLQAHRKGKPWEGLPIPTGGQLKYFGEDE